MVEEMINGVDFFKSSKLVRAPFKATDGSIGYDVFAYKEGVEDMGLVCEIDPLDKQLISTGLRFRLVNDIYIEVHSRSGLSLKKSLFVLNAPGIVDTDYRGVVKVILSNFSNSKVSIYLNDPIAQIIFKKNHCKVGLNDRGIYQDQLLKETERGEGGFGSTSLEKGECTGGIEVSNRHFYIG